MRINEVLECANKALDEIRESEVLQVKGHFVSTTTVRKSMGPYRQCDIKIIYVNLDSKENYTFCTASSMERCSVEEEKKLIDTTEAKALTLFFLKQHEREIWKQIVEGSYGNK